MSKCTLWDEFLINQLENIILIVAWSSGNMKTKSILVFIIQCHWGSAQPQDFKLKYSGTLCETKTLWHCWIQNDNGFGIFNRCWVHCIELNENTLIEFDFCFFLSCPLLSCPLQSNFTLIYYYNLRMTSSASIQPSLISPPHSRVPKQRLNTKGGRKARKTYDFRLGTKMISVGCTCVRPSVLPQQ